MKTKQNYRPKAAIAQLQQSEYRISQRDTSYKYNRKARVNCYHYTLVLDDKQHNQVNK